MGLVIETPERLNHADTILYEIDMLHFAAQRLQKHHQQENWPDQRDAWVYLEAFLLHYRNLIEFLGKQTNVSDTDLHITTIWGLLNVPPPDGMGGIHAEGVKLWAKYEKVEDRISRYLQHCTTRRTGAKNWRINEMSDEIKPLLAAVEAELRPRAENPLVKPVLAVPFLGPHDASTTVSTNTSPPAVEIKPVDPPKQFE